MDYEWRIKVAERELAHLREMQQIHRAHMDVTDRSIETIGTTLERIETAVERLAVLQGVTEQKLATLTSTMEDLALLQVETERKLQGLLDALIREHANGKGGK